MTSSFSLAYNERMITVYWTCTATNQSESGMLMHQSKLTIVETIAIKVSVN